MKVGHHFSPKFGFTGSAGQAQVKPYMRTASPTIKPRMAPVAPVTPVQRALAKADYKG